MKRVLAAAAAASILLTLGAAYRDCGFARVPGCAAGEAVKYDPAAPAVTDEVDIIDTAAAGMIAQTIYGEARGCSLMEQAAVAWCILNRVDDGRFGATVEEVVTAPYQFLGYHPGNPVEEEQYNIAADVLRRHARESAGEMDVGRVLPREYLWFTGDGRQNHFRDAYKGGNYWDWSLPDPYEG